MHVVSHAFTSPSQTNTNTHTCMNIFFSSDIVFWFDIHWLNILFLERHLMILDPRLIQGKVINCIGNPINDKYISQKQYQSLWIVVEVFICYISPILKPRSLRILPPNRSTVIYLHSWWLGSQVTWRNPKWLVVDLKISWVPHTSIFLCCIFINSFMWQYMVYLIICVQKPVRILFISLHW